MNPIGAWYEDSVQGRLVVAIVDIDHKQGTAACVHEDGSLFIILLHELHVVRMDHYRGGGTYSIIENVKEFLEPEPDTVTFSHAAVEAMRSVWAGRPE